ncbi:hypothetical protein [Lysobacter sp. 1R34A]|uniref:hypothetical protein n=1 Tax=Lysobacter sp. 1R34A TaxID=3445786 RepID=UPI003EEE01B8
MSSKNALYGLMLTCLWPGAVSASTAAQPDVPMRVSPWLGDSMDSKTCPIVHVYLAGARSAEAGSAEGGPVEAGPIEGGAALATVWRNRDDETSALEAWPTLHLSVAGTPYALRREGAHSDIETLGLERQRGQTLRWSDPGEKLSAELRLGPPSLSVEQDGRWVRLPAAQAAQARAEGASSLTRWRGRLTIDLRGQRWSREVEVESLCGP